VSVAVRSELSHTGVPFDVAVDVEVASVALEELDEALAEDEADELSELAELDELAALLDAVVPLPSPPPEHPPAKASAATMPVVAMPRMMPWMTACAEN
jgi:hypothetical protein